MVMVCVAPTARVPMFWLKAGLRSLSVTVTSFRMVSPLLDTTRQ